MVRTARLSWHDDDPDLTGIPDDRSVLDDPLFDPLPGAGRRKSDTATGGRRNSRRAAKTKRGSATDARTSAARRGNAGPGRHLASADWLPPPKRTRPRRRP